MSNFDFDELDKAVADALGANTASAPLNDPVQDTAEGQVERPVEEAPKKASPTAPPAARRSSGRFMDVVHPSSDMRTGSASRSGFTPPPVQPDQKTPTSNPADSFDNISDLGWTKPVESPFLPDTKVEKRPLGAEVPTGAAAQLLPEEDDILLEAPDELRIEATTMPDPIDFAAQNSAPATEVEDTGMSSIDIVDTQPVEDIQHEVLQSTPEDTTAPDTPAVADVLQDDPGVQADLSHQNQTGPASMTQQYEEKPSSLQESGAIYDTENYHQPVIEPVKKASGFWTVLWIFLLVALGAGAGVAFYLFVLPML